MPWTQKQMLRDANGDLIPQYWDVVEQEFKPLTGSDGANDVRLTGSNVVLLERAVRNSSVRLNVEAPGSAKGAILSLEVYGRTGTFAENEGVRLRAGSTMIPSALNYHVGSMTDFTADGLINHMIQINPDLQNNLTHSDFNASSLTRFVTVGILPQPRIFVQVDIVGTFESGQGIDCRLDLKWIY